ncbi:lambda-exonuclease family protein [Xenorhabdus sp. KJ12.1]|uniref:lambda-exonuclease family protein n=1 Tax=Xenorhabdus sp. KJ12.1 TaxID=1851571 RepID=UPI000C045513|nr:YqaJ viral recombinase family protein [Xenorhabdus sp. KJ12.1]PHM72205.1 endonuclease [Xenorhabdus sp. KJ12.1]
MNSVMVVVDVEQGTPEWLEWRKTGVTATCAPILMRVKEATKTPYQLYLQYIGLLEPEDLSVIPQVRAGKLNEPLARAWAEEKYGQISQPLCVSHRDYPYMIASLDGQFDDMNLLEIKNLSTQKHLDILKNKEYSLEFRYYFWQVQHQLFVTGAPGAYLLFWSAKDEPIVFYIKPNIGVQEELLKRSTSFFDSVKCKVAPVFNTEKDVLLIEDAEILKQTLGFYVPDDLDVRMSALRGHTAALEKAKAEVERLEKLTKADIAGLADSLGFRPEDLVRIDGFGIRYIESVAKGTTNWKNLAKKLDPNVDPAQHPDCVNNDRKIYKLTTYEYVPTSSDTIAVAVPDAVKQSPRVFVPDTQNIVSQTSILETNHAQEKMSESKGILVF